MKRLSLQMIRILTGTVHFITQKWMTDTCHMHTNLMRSACFQTAFHMYGANPAIFEAATEKMAWGQFESKAVNPNIIRRIEFMDRSLFSEQE